MVKINGSEYELSDNKNKKLKIKVNNKWVHFGDSRYEHYFDKTKLLNPQFNHLDKERRTKYLSRASKIKDKEGNLTANDPNSPNYHSMRILW
jgi:hypothetical protein